MAKNFVVMDNDLDTRIEDKVASLIGGGVITDSCSNVVVTTEVWYMNAITLPTPWTYLIFGYAQLVHTNNYRYDVYIGINYKEANYYSIMGDTADRNVDYPCMSISGIATVEKETIIVLQLYSTEPLLASSSYTVNYSTIQAIKLK